MVKKISFHIGAHKTGTTHFQDTLKEIQSKLRQENIHYDSREEFRKNMEVFYPWGIKRLLRNVLPFAVTKRIITERILPKVQSWQHFIISEENIPGSCTDLLDNNIYINICERLKILDFFKDEYEIQILLSIRSFDRVLPGAYVTDLKYRPDLAISKKESLSKTLNSNNCPSWFELLSRIVAAYPTIPIKVWTQENYKCCSDNIIKQVLGVKHLSIPNLSPPKATITPDFDVVTKLEVEFKKNKYSYNEWINKCDELLSQHPVSNDKQRYTFLSLEQIKILKKSYLEDLVSIRKKWPNMLID